MRLSPLPYHRRAPARAQDWKARRHRAETLHVRLPRAAALVYHGGIGTCSQALAAGIPHLIMPLAHDQPDNANRLRRLGIGLSLHPKKFTGERVAAALRHLLKDNAVQANCTRYAEQMRVAPSLDELAAWLEARVGV
jgi:rhamnosyltransferase subunit B